MSDAAQELREFNVKELSRRNGETAQVAFRELDSRISGLHSIIIAQQQGIMALQSRVLELEGEVLIQRVSNVGSGPTEG